MNKEINIKKITCSSVLDDAMEWINKIPSEIEKDLKEENNLLNCIEVFYGLTKFYSIRCIENTGQDWQKFVEKRIEILTKFINIVFRNISNEMTNNIIEKWYEKVTKNDKCDDISEVFATLPNKEISESIKFMFFKIDNRFILGSENLLQEFCKNKVSQGIREENIQDLDNINNAKIVILTENRELLIYTVRNNIERKISFDKIIDCNYAEEKIIHTSLTIPTLTIRTEDLAFPELVVKSYDEDFSLYNLYKEIINNINNSKTNTSNQTIEDRLRQLKKLLDSDLITELEYNEKRKQILLEL